MINASRSETVQTWEGGEVHNRRAPGIGSATWTMDNNNSKAEHASWGVPASIAITPVDWPLALPKLLLFTTASAY